MFKKDVITDIYFFPKCSSIHTHFMKQNIDICIVDKDYYVTYVEASVKPNKVIIKKGYHTFEMPLGLSNYINVGDTLCTLYYNKVQDNFNITEAFEIE